MEAEVVVVAATTIALPARCVERFATQCSIATIDRFDAQYQGQAPQNNQPAAYVAAPKPLVDLNWYADSGATDHITA